MGRTKGDAPLLIVVAHSIFLPHNPSKANTIKAAKATNFVHGLLPKCSKARGRRRPVLVHFFLVSPRFLVQCGYEMRPSYRPASVHAAGRTLEAAQFD
jgi:hypothetical protein